MDAAELLEATRRELSPIERAIAAHRFVAALEAGDVSKALLGMLAGEQRLIVASDRRSFAHLATRFPEPPAGDLFLLLAQGESEALRRLAAFAAAVGLGEHEPRPGCQAYSAYVAWLALNGSPTDVALAFLVNLPAWGGNCARVAAALRARYGLDDDAVAFFDFFAEPTPEFERRALEVVEAGLAGGDRHGDARRAARLLQAYELHFWDTLALEL